MQATMKFQQIVGGHHSSQAQKYPMSDYKTHRKTEHSTKKPNNINNFSTIHTLLHKTMTNNKINQPLQSKRWLPKVVDNTDGIKSKLMEIESSDREL